MIERKALELVYEQLEAQNVRRNRLLLVKALLKSSELGSGYTYSKIAELMDLPDPSLEDSIKQKIKRYIDQLNDELSKNEAAINKALIESGIEYGLRFEKISEGGGSGNLAEYKLVKKSIDESEKRFYEPQTNNGDVQYQIREIESLPVWSRALQRIALSGRKQLVYTATPLIIVLSAIAMIAISWSINSYEMLAIVILITSLIIYLIKPMYKVLDYGIVKAPDWLVPFKETNSVIVKRPSKDANTICLVSFDAICPICSGRIFLKHHKNNKTKLIGCCEYSGQEHSYSFDHITKQGFYLGDKEKFRLLKNK